MNVHFQEEFLLLNQDLLMNFRPFQAKPFFHQDPKTLQDFQHNTHIHQRWDTSPPTDPPHTTDSLQDSYTLPHNSTVPFLGQTPCH